jgi:hypothetical protein
VIDRYAIAVPDNLVIDSGDAANAHILRHPQGLVVLLAGHNDHFRIGIATVPPQKEDSALELAHSTGDEFRAGGYSFIKVTEEHVGNRSIGMLVYEHAVAPDRTIAGWLGFARTEAGFVQVICVTLKQSAALGAQICPVVLKSLAYE